MKRTRSKAIGGGATRAVAYLRVSTTREQQELGIEAQRQAIGAWARREGIELVASFEEEVSGGAPLEKRPVLLRAIAALKEHGAALLVVQRLDRFSRDPLSAAMAELQVHRVGARVVCADGVGNGDDPGSRLMKDVGLAAARFERAMIAARTKAALAVKKARGESTGTPPYGWRLGDDGKSLVSDEHEQRVLATVRGLRERGLSFRAVRAEAARLGLFGRTVKPFTLQAIYTMTCDVVMRRPTLLASPTYPRTGRGRKRLRQGQLARAPLTTLVSLPQDVVGRRRRCAYST